MDSKNVTGCGGIKVTYIETQFVTSDEAGFKDLVQRLTGRSAPPPPPPHRPLPCWPADGGRRGRTAAAGAAAGTQQVYGQYQYPVVGEVRPAAVISRTPAYLEDMDMADFFSDLLYVGASERSNACYDGFPSY